MIVDLRLSELRTLRHAIEAALGSGADYVELEILGRRVRKLASVEVLEYLGRQIAREEGKASAVREPARNRARVVR